nr:MAG TPA: hypothetical protein [Caudoviricetes sp.]
MIFFFYYFKVSISIVISSKTIIYFMFFRNILKFIISNNMTWI